MGSFVPAFMVVFFLATFALSLAADMSIIDYSKGINNVGELRTEEEVRLLYEEWMVIHKRSYSTLEEKERRFEIFKDNVRFIDEHNDPKKNNTYTVGLNHFADLTDEEYQSTYLRTRVNMSELVSAPVSKRYQVRSWDKLPNSMDWRSRGAVGPVKNQGICESCWAFSAVATVESLNQIMTGNLITLSEQELVDCDKSNHGCHRGFPHKAYQYMMTNKGIDTDTNYPYISQNGIEGRCRWNKRKAVSIDRYEYGPFKNEQAIKKAVANQPVSVAVDSQSRGFKFCKSGIFTGVCGTKIDHAVVIVGYGTQNNIDYWLVKNSWSDMWGEGGYIKMERNIASRDGKCGIAKYFTYPVMRKLPRKPFLSSTVVHGMENDA